MSVETAVAFVSVAMATFFAALWLGERGRRRDLAWLVKLDRADSPATVSQGDDGEATAAELLSSEERDKMVQALIDETGCSLKDAQRDVEQMMAQLHRQSMDGW